MGVIFKRMMLKAASKVADAMEEKNGLYSQHHCRRPQPVSREVVHVVSQNEVIIDIRHPKEEIKPFQMPRLGVIKMPFYRLRIQFPELDKTHQYLLYCEKGVMSLLHAMHLKEAGHDNVEGYNPDRQKP